MATTVKEATDDAATDRAVDATSDTVDKLATEAGAVLQESADAQGASATPVCLVIGAGDATGSAIAKRFAGGGMIACVARRNGDKLAPLVAEIEAQGGRAIPFTCDARDEAQMVDMVTRIEREIGSVEVAVFNIGANVRFSITETTTRVYTKVWEMCALGGFHTGREAARVMLPRGRGTILFTGATASVRGGSGYAAFAGGKHALRALAQSMARELGPKGIHVAHVVIDGAIDTEFIRTQFPDRYALKKDGGILAPDSIAEQYWQIHRQSRDAWTFEMDLRPAMETW